MYNHTPTDYICPFCLILNGQPTDFGRQYENIVYKNELVTAFIASRWWRSAPAHVLVIPNEHIENIYDLPENIGHAVFDAIKKVALALKAVYKCDGISTRQHNEPDGGQDVWHYHQHVYPRYEGKYLYLTEEDSYHPTPEERQPYADRLIAYFNTVQ